MTSGRDSGAEDAAGILERALDAIIAYRSAGGRWPYRLEMHERHKAALVRLAARSAGLSEEEILAITAAPASLYGAPIAVTDRDEIACVPDEGADEAVDGGCWA